VDAAFNSVLRRDNNIPFSFYGVLDYIFPFHAVRNDGLTESLRDDFPRVAASPKVVILKVVRKETFSRNECVETSREATLKLYVLIAQSISRRWDGAHRSAPELFIH